MGREEKLHGDAMLFRAQCLWRDYEELMEKPHNKRREEQLLGEIDILESNLRDLGFYSNT